jgi:nucleoside-diphosphate-sugar epimerase
MKKAVLVSGATGFVGKNLLTAINDIWEAHALVRPSSQKTNIANVFRFEDNIDDLHDYLLDYQINGVVHLAALALDTHKTADVKKLIDSNVWLGTAILEAALNTNVKWFVNTGTFWQHYLPDSQDYHPVNLYAATKQAFVDLAKFYAETSPIKFVTLKICDTFGPNDTRNKIFNLWRKIAQNNETLDMSPGEQFIDLLYIDDVVDGFLHLISLLNSNASLQNDYALYANKRFTLRELAELYQNVTNSKLNIRWGQRPYRNREVMVPWYAGTPLPGWKSKCEINDYFGIFNLTGGGQG